jgi:hypothetical protein
MKKVSLSYKHTEMMPISECIREITRQRNFLHELGAPRQTPTFIGEDNIGTVTYAGTEKLSDLSKHLHLLIRHIKEEQGERDGRIDVTPRTSGPTWTPPKTLAPAVYVLQKAVRLGTARGSQSSTSTMRSGNTL